MQSERIRKSREFSFIYNNSKKVYTRYAIVFVKENNLNCQRFGYVASRKTGKAVQRNRIKRLFREFVNLNRSKLKQNADYIFVGKSSLKENIRNLRYKDIEKDMLKVIRQ